MVDFRHADNPEPFHKYRNQQKGATDQIDEALETCPKCEARMVPMMAIETVPSWSMKLDEEDPDYSSDDPYFDADGEVSIGFRVCRNCQTMLTFWIESATAKFMPDWGHKRPDQEALERQRVPEGYSDLPAKVLAMCKHRGWSMDWTHRGVYLHLESSELIEAVRGKRGTVLEESGDVLLVLMSITEYHGIPFELVLHQADLKCKDLMTKPRFKGEEHDGSTLAAAPEPATDSHLDPLTGAPKQGA